MPERPIKRGRIWLVDLPSPAGSEPGDEHPILILQINDFTRTSINTVIGAVITSAKHRAYDPGNVMIERSESDLDYVSVVNVSQIVTFDKGYAIKRIGRLCDEKMREVETGVRLWLGLDE